MDLTGLGGRAVIGGCGVYRAPDGGRGSALEGFQPGPRGLSVSFPIRASFFTVAFPVSQSAH